jgi:hypothetical protein
MLKAHAAAAGPYSTAAVIVARVNNARVVDSLVFIR